MRPGGLALGASAVLHNFGHSDPCSYRVYLTSSWHGIADVPEEDIEAQPGNNVLQPLDNTPKKKPLNLMVKLSQVPKSHARPMHPQPEELSSPECLHAQQSPEKLLLMR